MKMEIEVLEVPEFVFEFEGERYTAVGSWEIGWVKWALRQDKARLRSFIQREIRLLEEAEASMQG